MGLSNVWNGEIKAEKLVTLSVSRETERFAGLWFPMLGPVLVSITISFLEVVDLG